MNISYITTYDASDIHQWSGLGYYMAEALRQQNAEVDLVGDIHGSMPKYLELKNKVYNKLGKRFLPERVPWLVNRLAGMAEKRIKPSADIVFAPSTIPIGMIQTSKPKVFYTDATFAGMIDYYPYFTNLSAESIRNGNKVEQAALDSCTLAIYSSDWAAQTAIDNYKVDAGKIKVVPFGANIQSNRTLIDINNITQKKDTKTCHLLFIGIEWERKGGGIAVETARMLNEAGLPTILHIVGISTDALPGLPSYVVNHGFISKRTHEGQSFLEKLFTQCHFLILPSRADCTPVVYAEANSFGLPCITTNTGGIPSIIKDDVNGKMFVLADEAEQYAKYIEARFLDNIHYTELSGSSFNEYATRLNWQTSGKAIMDLLKAL